MAPAHRPASVSVASPGDPASGVRPRTGGSALDAGGLGVFVREQYERLPELARKLRVPEHDAEDMLQRSLEKLWLHHETIDSSRWDAWLWLAMRFQCMDRYKRARRAREIETEVTLLLEDWQGSPSPEAEAYQRECAGELLALLDRLAPERRAVVRLYLIDDLPMAEVAARLGISENTAKDRWRLACNDMEHQWGRERARERSKLGLSVFLTAAAAVLLAFFRRFTAGAPRRAGQLLACAACVLLLGPEHDERPGVDHGGAVASETTQATGHAPTGPHMTAAPPSAPPVPEDDGAGARPQASPDAEPARPAHDTPMARTARHPATRPARSAAVPERDADPSPEPDVQQPPPPGEGRAEDARKHLLAIATLLRNDRKEAALELLRLYRQTFPADPWPDHHRQLAAAAARIAH